MSDKLKLILLAALVVVLALIWWLGGTTPERRGERTLPRQLLQVDTAALRSFTITPPPPSSAPLQFQRDSAGWTVRQGLLHTRAFQRPLNTLLAALADMHPLAMPGTGAATLARYRLGDSAAVVLRSPQFPGGAAIRVGGSTGGPATPTLHAAEAATAVMAGSDPNVYLVPGTFAGVLRMGFQDWIPKPMVNGDPANWQRITFVFPGGVGYSLERTRAGWTANGQPADSTKVEKYLRALSRYYGSTLADPADTLHAVLVYSLRVEDRTRQEPVLLGIFQVQNRLIARSTLAPPWIVMQYNASVDLPRMFRPPEAFLPGTAEMQR
ncbi:MAG: DUF4340 domain-containing protein [Bacteroidetes bacterium]|nr:DUF4340 domain-containing protein [Bacteroidota bacterium]